MGSERSADHDPALTAVAAVLLISAAFPKFPVIAMIGILLSLAVFFLYFMRTLKIDRIGLALIALFMVTLASGLLSGGISLPDLGDLRFYDGEGRFFIAYIPLLPFMVAVGRPVESRLLLSLIFAISALTVVLALVWVPTRLAYLTHGGRFYGFFTHHSGGATLCIVFMTTLIAYGQMAKRRLHTILGLSLLLPILTIGSRQALVALLAVLLALSVRRPARLLLVGAGLGLMTVIAPVIAPSTFVRVAEVFDEATLRNVQMQMFSLSWDPGKPMAHHLVGREWNILSRILLYSHSIKNFLWSPWLGIGFGRINDANLLYEGVKGIVFIAVGGTKIFNTLSAHNSLLNIIAEGGVLTLAVWILFWGEILRRLSRAGRAFRKHGMTVDAAMVTGAQNAFIAILVGSFFDHAFASPTFMIPTMVLIGATLANFRNLQLRSYKSDASQTCASAPLLGSPSVGSAARQSIP